MRGSFKTAAIYEPESNVHTRNGEHDLSGTKRDTDNDSSATIFLSALKCHYVLATLYWFCYEKTIERSAWNTRNNVKV